LIPAAVLGAALVLAGCSGGDDDGDESGSESSSEAATAAGEDLPTVDPAFGGDPTIEFPGSGAPAELMTEVLTEGDGPEVGADDTVVANYVGQVWDGEVFDSSFERGAPTAFGLNQVIQGWKEALTGTHVGDRVIMSTPADLGYGPQGGQPAAGIEADDTLVFVVDVIDTFAPDAQAQADATVVEQDGELPVTISGDLGAEATITINEGAEEPTEPTATVIAEGTGDPVSSTPGTSVLVQYAAATWDGATTESSWQADGLQSQTIGMGSVVDWLADIPVGSRVLVTAPASDDGSQPAAAFVMDIVGSVPGPETADTGVSSSESGSESGSESAS
jgi:peptidylprolyl isomerase